MKLLGINLFKKKQEQNINQKEFSNALKDDNFQLELKKIMAEVKKRNIIKADNFTKIAQITDNYAKFPHLKGLQSDLNNSNPLSFLQNLRNDIQEKVKTKKGLKELSKETGLPKKVVLKKLNILEQSTKNLSNALINPNLSESILKSIPNVLEAVINTSSKLKI